MTELVKHAVAVIIAMRCAAGTAFLLFASLPILGINLFFFSIVIHVGFIFDILNPCKIDALLIYT